MPAAYSRVMSAQAEYLPPKTWQEFEELCADTFATDWNDPALLRHFALRSQHRRSPCFESFGSELAIHRRYTERRFLGIPYCYLQGITVRPVPCNYNVIQFVSALSRR
jgi:hypothetical protein